MISTFVIQLLPATIKLHGIISNHFTNISLKPPRQRQGYLHVMGISMYHTTICYTTMFI